MSKDKRINASKLKEATPSRSNTAWFKVSYQGWEKMLETRVKAKAVQALSSQHKHKPSKAKIKKR